MARMTEDGMSTFAGQSMKSRTVRCPHCSIELNLPESALGRRLKCPKCEMKFTAAMLNQPGPNSSSYLPAHGPGSSGSVELPSFGGSSGDVELPTSLAPLRDTYELPFMTDDVPAPRGKSASGSVPAAKGDVGDAMALFQDEPKSNRKPRGAEARAQARRCSSCSSIVPAGMSLCSKCGLDLDTGQRTAPLELYDDDMPVVHRAPAPPIGVLLVGSLCSLGFLLLAMVSLIQWSRGLQGAQFLMVIWLFGLFGGVQFLRRKSVRPILLSLSIAAVVGAVYLIALPIYYANMPPEVAPTEVTDEFDVPQIVSLTEKIDVNRITLGVGSLLSYAAIAVYLNSPGLRRQFKH